MPEIKHFFNQGKMNKDLDERLVENGQYRDAMNIQVSTSEGSDVGAVQNLLGNLKVSKALPNSICVGAIADEKNNALYWFITNSIRDSILEYKDNEIKPVLVDTEVGTTNAVLKFNSNNIITGINIIDNLLFWTDNETEPKKINIDLCKQGSQDNPGHTLLIVPDRNITASDSIKIREEHITVIKKAPKTKLTLNMSVEVNTTAVLSDATFTDPFGNLLPMASGSVIPLVGAGLFIGVKTGTFSSTAGEAPVVGDEILLLDQASAGSLPKDYSIKLKILADLSGTPDGSGSTFPPMSYRAEIVDGYVVLGQENWNVFKKAKQEDFFEKQFARFSYRYKYQDGEYSTFAPFSEIAFKPSSFDYETKKAYNLGMQNKLKELKLKNFVETDILEDVIQIDLLYKESNSPNVYIVESLKYNDFRNPNNNWDNNSYQINSDLIYSTLPSNQLLRPYDNVPRKALAQEITGNRIVYGNYVQNYNLTKKPIINSSYTPRTGVTVTDGVPNKSLKSLRNYQLGISYLDDYGRQTPIFSNTTSSFKIPKDEAQNSNALQFTTITSAPDWAKSYKIFVKETSNEYYNLAMDRVYKAQDGNIWLSFPSSERNKVDEETFLILKKQLDANVQVEENLKYKIIAIENEAPVEVKTNTAFVASSNGNGAIANLFTGDMPLINDKYFEISEEVWKTDNGPSIDNFTETLSIKFRDTAAGISSDFYEIAFLEFKAPHYNITLKNKIKESDSWIYNNYANITSFAASNLNSDLTLRVYKNVVKDQPKFDGKFFVKILNDASTEQYVLKGVIDAITYTSVGVVNCFYISDTGADTYTNSLVSLVDLANTGTTGNWSSNNRSAWVSNILNFNNNERSSEWFVDQVYYAGSFTSGDVNDSHNSPSGYGKGIYKVPGGGPGGVDQWYMELSFSKIEPDPDSTFIEYGGQGDALLDVDLGGVHRGRLNEDIIQDPKLFAIGSSSNPEHEDQNSIVSQLKQNKLFKFVGDQNRETKYIINGTVSMEKRFNYMPFTTVRDAMDILEDPLQVSSSSSFLSFGVNGGYRATLQDAWNEFTESFNRRVTYIIPFALYQEDAPINTISQQPVYAPADPLLNSHFLHTDGTTAYTNFIDTDVDRNGTRDGHGADNDTARSILFLDISEGEEDQLISDNPAIWETEPKENIDLDIYYEASECFDISLHGTTQELDWFNCYSFNNGVESNRLRDDFNQTTVDKGAVVSSTIDFVYEQETRKSGLIYSGLYNSTSGVNNLNQFIAAEKITKDLNPTYGSIQKLYSRDSDLLAFCEDKVIRIYANKDALYNADGNINLVSTNRVLGQSDPFSGEYGISQNPESFAVENYRVYFTDKQRGAVLRLSMDGLTPISKNGMADYFSDNLKLNTKIIGSYDGKKNEYNVTLTSTQATISFDEKVKGWVSHKSFIPEIGMSMANDYYTFKNGNLYLHHVENIPRNTFYQQFIPSSMTVLLNDEPSTIKNYKTLGYEGTQSRVKQETTDVRTGYYNLTAKKGWYSSYIKTDKQQGTVDEFIEKEGKWFNFIKGKDVAETLDVKTEQFSFQGIGSVKEITIDNAVYVENVVLGCTNIDAVNYDPLANTDDGSCLYTPAPIPGCTDPLALNYDDQATIDDGSCTYVVPDEVDIILGCTDPTAFNYNPLATVDDKSCMWTASNYGCTDPDATNYNSNATIDDGSCVYAGPSQYSVTVSPSNYPIQNSTGLYTDIFLNSQYVLTNVASNLFINIDQSGHYLTLANTYAAGDLVSELVQISIIPVTPDSGFSNFEAVYDFAINGGPDPNITQTSGYQNQGDQWGDTKNNLTGASIRFLNLDQYNPSSQTPTYNVEVNGELQGYGGYSPWHNSPDPTGLQPTMEVFFGDDISTLDPDGNEFIISTDGIYLREYYYPNSDPQLILNPGYEWFPYELKLFIQLDFIMPAHNIDIKLDLDHNTENQGDFSWTSPNL